MLRFIDNGRRHWLRLLAVLALAASWAAASLELATGLSSGLLLLTAALLPLLWPRQFGSWRGLLLLLLAILAPALAVAAWWPELEARRPELASFVLVWVLVAWMMAPATLALLSWRRFASIPLMLLALVIAPAASLLMVMLGMSNADAAIGDPPTVMRLLAAMTPMWFLSLMCCLGPVFFLGMLAWFLYLEATRGETGVARRLTPAPPAKAATPPHSGSSAGPGGS